MITDASGCTGPIPAAAQTFLANTTPMQARRLNAHETDRGAPPGDEEVARWRAKLAAQATQYDRIVESFFARERSADLTGLEAPASCNWDRPSLDQLAATRTRWPAVRERIAAEPTAAADATTALAAARVLASRLPWHGANGSPGVRVDDIGCRDANRLPITGCVAWRFLDAATAWRHPLSSLRAGGTQGHDESSTCEPPPHGM